MELKSAHLKALLFEYFRFQEQMLCVSEIQGLYKDIEDFIAYTPKNIICVEIKTSYSDFIQDFKTKQKHATQASLYNKFYFCVTPDIKDKVIDYLSSNNYPTYGVLTAVPYYTKSNTLSYKISSVRSARKIRSNIHTISPTILNTFNRRACSELTNLLLEKFHSDVKQSM